MSYDEVRFSEWIESIRKDIECFFGILKKRFTVLMTGVRTHSIKKCDEVFLTCCALHNRLLYLDGLDQDWEEDSLQNVVPYAIERLNKFGEGCQGAPSNLCKINFDAYSVNGYRIVSKIPHRLFQKCLIEHFNIRFRNKDVYWPVKNKT